MNENWTDEWDEDGDFWDEGDSEFAASQPIDDEDEDDLEGGAGVRVPRPDNPLPSHAAEAELCLV